MSVRDLIILGCSSQQPTRRRNHGAYLFRWNEEGLLFDPGEGTQRQFIFANVAPTCVTKIFISHFHGDHCLGLGSMLMRLNLDKVRHPIHCFYPASGKKYFDRLRYGTIYREGIDVVEHPVSAPGVVYTDEKFTVEADFLEHGVDNLGWRVTESSRRKFDPEKLKQLGLAGERMRELIERGSLDLEGRRIGLEEVSWIQKGESIAVVIDTRPCRQALQLAQGARLLLSESTYLERERELARKYHHMTSREAALIAKEAGVKLLVLTHFSARYLDLRPFEKEAREIFPQTEVAEDLKVIPFPRSA